MSETSVPFVKMDRCAKCQSAADEIGYGASQLYWLLSKWKPYMAWEADSEGSENAFYTDVRLMEEAGLIATHETDDGRVIAVAKACNHMPWERFVQKID